MKTYIEKEPVFSDSIQLTETTDPGNADYMNISTKQIFANTLVNKKEAQEGDSKNRTITFESKDSENANKWTNVAVMESGEEHRSLIEKISIIFKNVRYLHKLLGTTDISKIGDGTVTGAIKKVNKALKPIDAENRIEEMTSINQITSVGFWKIAAIENNYAREIGIDNNVGDFYAIVSNYNGNGADRYAFGDLLLFSPRLQGYHYAINIWNENAQARLVLTNDNILTTKEQINANTDLRNVAGAMAMKEMFSEINSNLANINATGLTKIGAVPWKNIIITNSGWNAVVFFSNWTGEKCFPENYGSGIILPCVDVTHKRILYIGRSGKLYTGFFFVSDKDNITWYS